MVARFWQSRAVVAKVAVVIMAVVPKLGGNTKSRLTFEDLQEVPGRDQLLRNVYTLDASGMRSHVML